MKDKDNIKVVGQVIDSSTGFMLNAARMSPAMSGVGGITAGSRAAWQVIAAKGEISISASGASAAIYDMAGRKCASATDAAAFRVPLQPGVYVVTIYDSAESKTYKIKL